MVHLMMVADQRRKSSVLYFALIIHSVFSDSPGAEFIDDGRPPSFSAPKGLSRGYPGRFEGAREELQVVDDLVYNHWLIHAPSGRYGALNCPCLLPS